MTDEMMNLRALLENDEWAVQRSRYMTLETIAPLSDDLIVSLPAVAA
jgi:putative transposase